MAAVERHAWRPLGDEREDREAGEDVNRLRRARQVKQFVVRRIVEATPEAAPGTWPATVELLGDSLAYRQLVAKALGGASVSPRTWALVVELVAWEAADAEAALLAAEGRRERVERESRSRQAGEA